MKLKLYIDLEAPSNDIDCCEEVDKYGSSSNWYVNQRLSHENTNMENINRDFFRNFCPYIYRSELEQKCMLINIPDELLFQEMILGLHDYDYIVYNIHTKIIELNDDLSDAIDRSRDYDCDSNNPVGWASSISADADSQLMFDWSLSNEIESKTREPFKSRISSSTYKEIKEIIDDYVNFYYVSTFKKTSSTIEFISALNLKNNVKLGKKDIKNYGYKTDVYEICSENYGEFSSINLHLSRTESLYIVDSFYNSDELFELNKHMLTEQQIEILRDYVSRVLAFLSTGEDEIF